MELAYQVVRQLETLPAQVAAVQSVYVIVEVLEVLVVQYLVMIILVVQVVAAVAQLLLWLMALRSELLVVAAVVAAEVVTKQVRLDWPVEYTLH